MTDAGDRLRRQEGESVRRARDLAGSAPAPAAIKRQLGERCGPHCLSQTPEPVATSTAIQQHCTPCHDEHTLPMDMRPRHGLGNVRKLGDFDTGIGAPEGAIGDGSWPG